MCINLIVFRTQYDENNCTYVFSSRNKLEEKYFAAPGGSAAPPADEPGAVLTGHLKGRPVYQRPDGSYFQIGE